MHPRPSMADAERQAQEYRREAESLARRLDDAERQAGALGLDPDDARRIVAPQRAKIERETELCIKAAFRWHAKRQHGCPIALPQSAPSAVLQAVLDLADAIATKDGTR